MVRKYYILLRSKNTYDINIVFSDALIAGRPISVTISTGSRTTAMDAYLSTHRKDKDRSGKSTSFF